MAFVTQSPPRLPASRAPARWGTLSLALGAGLAAALFAFLLVRSHSPTGASAPDTVTVVAAAHAIPARTRLTAALVQECVVPVSRAQEGAFANLADVLGKITVLPIAAGAPVIHDALAAPGAASGLAFALPPSERAVTFALDPADGVDEFARPGDHVDILATDEPGSGPAETRTVLQNVALLAVGAQTSEEDIAAPASPPAGGASHVTVAVSPAQAQALVLAAARGKIHLALRPADDDGVAALSAFPAPPVAEVEADTPGQEDRPAKQAASPKSRPVPKPVLVERDALPDVPLSPLPVMPPVLPRPASVTITVIKGSQSQTVSVAP